MSKTWYPVIDYTKCRECGLCVNDCPHAVYDTTKAPTPVVSYPIGCINGCHRCGNRCLEGAIKYVGDDSDWTPPHGVKEEKLDCCCSGSCGDKADCC